jgi:hypothetical protein
MRAQRGVRALAARFLILHSGKLVALAAFGAAMQLPGLVGWVLTGGLHPEHVYPSQMSNSRTSTLLCLRSLSQWNIVGETIQQMSSSNGMLFKHPLNGGWRGYL